MRVLAKTFGWLLVSGLIIFISNLSAGVDWKVALIGAAVAKIGTTIAYFFYEVGFERAWKRQAKATISSISDLRVASTPDCPCPA
jgi:uncharacterized membrane protein